MIDPAPYLEMIALLAGARAVMTDSGGVQKEAFFLKVPCITLRDETEWVETVQGGGNILAGVEPDAIREAVSVWDARVPAGRADFSAAVAAAFGDGHAADAIRDAVLAFIAPGERASHVLL